MVKKVILCILVIFVAWLLAVLLHNWGVDFYKKYYSFKRDLSFGIIIHFVFLYYFPVTLVGVLKIKVRNICIKAKSSTVRTAKLNSLHATGNHRWKIFQKNSHWYFLPYVKLVTTPAVQ